MRKSARNFEFTLFRAHFFFDHLNIVDYNNHPHPRMNEMQSVTIHYVQPVNFQSFLYVFIFHLFPNIFKTVFRPSNIWFCREFQALPFDNKKGFYRRNNRGEILKILRHPLFLGDPLKQFYYAFTLKTIFHRFCNHNTIFCFIL